jgi:mRNA interferase MazF
MKDFGTWNTCKISIRRDEKNRWCRPRDIWWCKMGVNIGFEQDGKGENFVRPVVVLQSFGKYTALIVPITTSIKENRYHVYLGKPLGLKASAIITQLRLVDTKRLIEKAGKLEEGVFDNVKRAIKDLL